MRGRSWTDEEQKLLKKYTEEGLGCKTIAKLMKRSSRTIFNKRKLLVYDKNGTQLDKKQKEPTDEQLDQIALQFERERKEWIEANRRKRKPIYVAMPQYVIEKLEVLR